MTQNWFATFALLSWPLLAAWLYHTRPVGEATLWTILGGQLLLPVGAFIKFAPGIPQFDKISIPNLAAFIGCVLVVRRRLRFSNGFGLPEALLLMALLSPFITSELNGDPIIIGSTILPPIDQYEALSAVVRQFFFLLPFFLGRQLLRSAMDSVNILRILVVAGLAFSFALLFEIRMSPQLHNWFYGYHPTSFIMEMRDGGFRPMVFMGHGLIAAFFAMTTVVAAASFWRAKIRILQLPAGGITAYLSSVLVLCKSAGALVYGIVLVPLVRWTKPQIQIRIALVLVSIALLYPILRAAELIPTSIAVQVAKSISEERAASLEFRLEQDEKLLAKASERLLFGWGRFGRHRVYDEEGRDISTTDGHWIITMGQFGLFGFIAEFGLLGLPVFRAASALRRTESARDAIFFAALSLIVAINIFDLLPNETVTPWTWLLAGALLGRAEALHAVEREKKVRVNAQLISNRRPSGLL
jgi:hypothetical protein